MKVTNLRCEYLTKPMGVWFEKPRLMWNCEGIVKQKGYEVVVEINKNIYWESGKIITNKMYCDYEGDLLPYKTIINWKVRIYDENDKPSKYFESSFETGLDESKKWESDWISGNYLVFPFKRYPVDYFKKDVELKDIIHARLYISACGLYEVKINGQKVGDNVLTPGITDYRKVIYYQTYDVKDLLVNGTNRIELALADGWYRGSVGGWGIRNQYGIQTKLIAYLECVDKNQKVYKIKTDSSWDWSNDGPFIFADNKDGEVVDNNKTPSYAHKALKTMHNVIPKAANNNCIKEHEVFNGNLIISPKGNKIYDFKQNMAGYVSFRVYAQKNDEIILRFGEMIDENGEFTQDNIQLKYKDKITPKQTIKLICRQGLNEYHSKFTVFGFRYCEVESEVKIDDIKAIAIYTDMRQTIKFDCSNELINQFVKNTICSTKSNSVDLPTDCPTRERHGWTGDAQIFADTLNYLFDAFTFEQKYLNDIFLWQKRNGKLPHIVPDGGADFYMNPMNGSVGWADAGIIIPYVLYQKYRDDRIIKRFLKGMEKYANFQEKRCGKPYITAKKSYLNYNENRYLNNAGQSYGEWAEPDDVHIMCWQDFVVPHMETATAYTKYTHDLLAEMEDIVGNHSKASEYREFASKVKKSYQALRDKNPNYSLDTKRQASLVRPLAFDLLNNKQKEIAQKNLIKALDDYGFKIGTGFLSTPLILDVLKDIDVKYAYRLLENEEIPGWLAMAKNGSTTIWEAWDNNPSSKGIASLNHYSKGAMCAWLFKRMCGIEVGDDNSFMIKPIVGGSLTYASCEYLSVYGLVKSSWQKKQDDYEFEIEIPCNCIGMITLPNGKYYQQLPGKKKYKMRSKI